MVGREHEARGWKNEKSVGVVWRWPGGAYRRQSSAPKGRVAGGACLGQQHDNYKQVSAFFAGTLGFIERGICTFRRRAGFRYNNSMRNWQAGPVDRARQGLVYELRNREGPYAA